MEPKIFVSWVAKRTEEKLGTLIQLNMESAVASLQVATKSNKYLQLK